MKTVPTVKEDLPEVVAVATTVHQDGEKAMTTNRMVVIHDQAMVIVLPMAVEETVTVTAHDLALQATEASRQRSAIGTNFPFIPPIIHMVGGFFFP